MDNRWKKDFFLIWQGSIVSCIGNVLYNFCISYWVYKETGSTALMGILYSVTTFTSLIFSPFISVLIDRLEKKKILIYCDLIQGILILCLGFIAMFNKLNTIMIMIVGISASICKTMFKPAIITLISFIVPPKKLVKIRSIHSGSNTLVGMFFEAVSGFIIMRFGVPLVIIANGITFIFSAFSELFIKSTENQKKIKEISINLLLGDLKENIKYIFYNKEIKTLFIICFFKNLCVSGLIPLKLAFCLNRNIDIVNYGFLTSFESFSSMIALAIMGLLEITAKKQYQVFTYGFMLSYLVLALGYLGNNFFFICIMFGLAEFLNMCADLVYNAFFLLIIPENKRASISSFMISATMAGTTISSLVLGALSEYFDIGILGAIMCILAILPFLLILNNKKMGDVFMKLMKVD